MGRYMGYAAIDGSLADRRKAREVPHASGESAMQGTTVLMVQCM